MRERTVCRALAIRQAAAARNRGSLPLNATRKLTLQPRLTDARIANYGHEMRMPVTDGTTPDRGQKLEFTVASHHRHVRSRPSGCNRCDCKPRADRLVLSFRIDRRKIPVVDYVSSHPVGFLAHDKTAGWRRCLQPRRSVDDVTHGERFASGRTRRHGHDGLACVDSAAGFEFHQRDGVEHAEAGPYRAFRIIAV